jgi:hypothetical protein
VQSYVCGALHLRPCGEGAVSYDLVQTNPGHRAVLTRQKGYEFVNLKLIVTVECHLGDHLPKSSRPEVLGRNRAAHG